MAMLILVAAVTIMNMLIGILCEATRTTAEVEKEEVDMMYLKHSLEHIVEENDTDKNGQMDIEDFHMLLKDPRACKALQKVGVRPERMVEFAECFFQCDMEGV